MLDANRKQKGDPIYKLLKFLLGSNAFLFYVHSIGSFFNSYIFIVIIKLNNTNNTFHQYLPSSVLCYMPTFVCMLPCNRTC